MTKTPRLLALAATASTALLSACAGTSGLSLSAGDPGAPSAQAQASDTPATPNAPATPSNAPTDTPVAPPDSDKAPGALARLSNSGASQVGGLVSGVGFLTGGAGSVAENVVDATGLPLAPVTDGALQLVSTLGDRLTVLGETYSENGVSAAPVVGDNAATSIGWLDERLSPLVAVQTLNDGGGAALIGVGALSNADNATGSLIDIAAFSDQTGVTISPGQLGGNDAIPVVSDLSGAFGLTQATAPLNSLLGGDTLNAPLGIGTTEIALPGVTPAQQTPSVGGLVNGLGNGLGGLLGN